jgi:tetratricopeptide (TPR) repeat protein
MRYSLLFFLLFPIFLFANNTRLPDGQESQIDSLKNLLPGSEGNNKLEILQKLTRQYLDISHDTCIMYCKQTVEMTEKLKSKGQKAKTYRTMGRSYYNVSDLGRSIKYLKMALQCYLEDKDYFEATKIDKSIANLYELQSNYTKSMAHIISAEKSCDTLINIFHDKIAIKRIYLSICNTKAVIYDGLDSIDMALNYYNKTLVYAIELSDSINMAGAYSNIAGIFYQLKKYDLAISEYKNALNIAKMVGEKKYEAAILVGIAAIYENQQQADSALINFQKAKQLFIETHDKYNLSVVNRSIATTYYNIANYKEALNYIFMALDVSMQIEAGLEIYNNYKFLSKTYEKIGRNDLALDYYKQYTIFKDSVTGQETRENIANIHIKYETEKKEKENQLLQKDVKIKEISIKQKNRLIIIFIIVILLVVTLLFIIYSFYKQKSKAYDVLVHQNLKSLKIEKKLEKSITDAPTQLVSGKADTTNRLNELHQRFEKFMIGEKPYLWADINMDEFCKKLNTNRTYLSKLINDQYKQGFNDLMCEYRVRTARDLMADSNNKHLSVEGIGEMSGFKNNATFHRQFKNLVNLTPKQFREKAQKFSN